MQNFAALLFLTVVTCFAVKTELSLSFSAVLPLFTLALRWSWAEKWAPGVSFLS